MQLFRGHGRVSGTLRESLSRQGGLHTSSGVTAGFPGRLLEGHIKAG